MLILEDLIAKMKVHFPRWMDIRRKINTSSGGHYLQSIGENISEIQNAINEYKKDFFIDNYLGKEDEVITFIYKFNIGTTDINNIEILTPGYDLTDIEKDFYEIEKSVYYNEGCLYTKQNIKTLEYSISGYKSSVDSEKIHVWNIFDEFAVFVGLRRFQWETNKELLNRIFAFSNNKANSSEIGLKNAIMNNLINIKEELDIDDILIERCTPENLIKYYNEFETVLDHLANINRDVYRTKRWDLDFWNFKIKSIDYIPHAWDIVLPYYLNGVGFDNDLKVEIVDAEMKTNATIYFYKKTLEYINSYIKNNNIKEKIKLDLVKHSDNLKPMNVKYRITTTDAIPLRPDVIKFDSYDYKIGRITQSVNDVFDEDTCEYNDIEIIDNSILKDGYKYKLSFKSKNPLEEMSINKVQVYNTISKEYKNLIIEQSGFEKISEDGVRCSLTKKYLAEKYHYTSVKNSHKLIDGFVISDVEKPTSLTANIDACMDETIFYEYECQEIPVMLHDIERFNCYIDNNTILSDTVSGEKYIAIKKLANSFSCNIIGPHKIIYSTNGEDFKTIERKLEGNYDFSIEQTELPKNLDIKIYLNPKNNMQCAITDIKYSKFEFEITTEHGEISNINGNKRLPNFMQNTLFVRMKTYIGFSPILKYIYIGTKLQDVVYGDIEVEAENGDKFIIDKTNCTAELTVMNNNGMTEFIDINYSPSKVIVGTSDNSYISIKLNNFKTYEKVFIENCGFDSINYGSQIQYIVKIPNGIHLREIIVDGEYERLIFSETLSNVLKRKGYPMSSYVFFAAKTCENIIVSSTINGKDSFIKIKKQDLIANNAAKIKMNMYTDDIQTVFVEDSINKSTSITNDFDGKFDYLYFYPTSTRIHKAINEYNIISPTTIVPQIINTFDNNYSLSNENSMYYTIESLNDEFDVNFKIDSTISNRVLDVYPIQIDKKDTTNMQFDYESIAVVYDSILGNTIDIPESFSVSNEKIETAKYLIRNDDIEIMYLNKYNDSIHENDYIITEIINIDNFMCNKLRYCNILEIEEITHENNEIGDIVNGINYKLFNDEGIINWTDISIFKPSDKVFVKYNIKKAKFIKLTIDQLYEKVDFTTNAYELINTVDLYEIKNNESYNLSIYDEYKDSSLISVKCSNIGFEANVSNNIITFTKNLKNNTVAVKTGYYYLDGDEYYLFANENKNNIESIDNIFMFNVIKENKMLYLNQTTTNLVSNSSLKTNSLNDVYKLNCLDNTLNGSSKINSITACDSFNYWKTVGVNALVTKGLNGSGIKFINEQNLNGYAYLDISKHLVRDGNKYTISFHMTGEGIAYLGEERKMYSNNLEFNKQSVIEAKTKALKSPIEDDIYELELLNNSKHKYYLIIQGNAMIDDIIVSEKSIHDLDLHTKNISFLNLDIKENIYANYQTRLYLDDTNGALFSGTEAKGNEILNSSHIDWGFTKTKEISTYDSFSKCTLTNVDVIKHNENCFIKTTSSTGKITTEPIYIGNVNTIKNLMFKINDVMFDNMKNFKVKILTSSNVSIGFKEISMHIDNTGVINGDKLSSYVKLIVEMPSNKVINNIELFTEYLSDEKNSPPEVPVINGSYISKVLDTQYNTRYLLKNLSYELTNTKLEDISFGIRASKQNTDSTVWTNWKEIVLQKGTDGKYIIGDRIIFEDYRYFQFRIILKGANASVKIKHLDLEVI